MRGLRHGADYILIFQFLLILGEIFVDHQYSLRVALRKSCLRRRCVYDNCSYNIVCWVYCVCVSECCCCRRSTSTSAAGRRNPSLGGSDRGENAPLAIVVRPSDPRSTPHYVRMHAKQAKTRRGASLSLVGRPLLPLATIISISPTVLMIIEHSRAAGCRWSGVGAAAASPSHWRCQGT